MELVYDLWHLAFGNLMQRRAPPNFEVQTEVRLTIEPQRADMLLLRRLDEANRDGEAQLPARTDLTLVLVIPSITSVVKKEIKRMGWRLKSLGNGYSQIERVVYPCYVVETDAVSEAEKDEYLRLFSRLKAQRGEATRWLSQWLSERKMKQPEIEGQPDYEEMFQKMVEAMPIEKRLAGLAPEELILALPVEALRALARSEDYLASLPSEVQQEVRRRIRQARD